jgi:hypothetical protein
MAGVDKKSERLGLSGLTLTRWLLRCGPPSKNHNGTAASVELAYLPYEG